MMHGREESDPAIRARKSANKAERSAAESMEQRAGAKGKTITPTTGRTQSREAVSPGLDRLRQRAKEHRDEKFTALLHHLNVDLLTKAYHWLKRDAAAGVDGVTWQTYGVELQAKLVDLHGRLHRGAYRAQPSRRRMIPKADGRERQLGIASLEDKIVQRALVEVLNAIYEPEFLGFSYGFRPGRSQHDALDALWVGIDRTPINWILDADIARFFDTVDHEWLVRFVEQRVGDQRVLRLIRKWLKAGVLENGMLTGTEMGTPQGSVISPLLSNLYLHYVLDVWAHQWRKRPGRGHMLIVRYADDVVCGFQHEADARAFHAELNERMATYALSLHPEKTRLIEFGRFASEKRKHRGEGRPETFAFLGFIHICGQTRKGRFLLTRKSRRDRMRNKLKEIGQTLRYKMHEPIPAQGKWLNRIVRGYFAYHAVPSNFAALGAFRYHVTCAWRRALQRRSQRAYVTWEKMQRLAGQWLPMPRILHPWPAVRFAASHPRWEPSA
jgi:RNA-directed DNA polymerase